jgi:SAM-dependent methyltransferase
MSCCGHNRATSRFFSWMAGGYRKRFEKKGFEASQKNLLQGLTEAGFEGARVLEIGSGAGNLHQSLLLQGAGSATGIDLAPGMLQQARDWARDRELESRLEYLQGDFVELAKDIADAEVTILDKVVCCYPDADALVHKSLDRTGRVYALTYPRYTVFNRVMSKIMGAIFWLIRFDFRNYVHHPKQISGWITDAGFHRRYSNHTLLWLTEVYVRDSHPLTEPSG